MSDRIVIFGAGALSLGFLGPELFRDYDLTFLDTAAKDDFVSLVQQRSAYSTNVAGAAIEHVTVQPVSAFRLDKPEDDAAIREHISTARIFFTAVGVRNLDKALLYLFERIRNRTDELFILCAENGENIAEKWRAQFPRNMHLCDTVMGRMCRLEEGKDPDYVPVGPGIQWGVVGEALRGMPLSDAHFNAEVFHTKAFDFMPEEQFHARERIKLFAHNGLHFFIAAVGHLRGAERFSDLNKDREVTAAATDLLNHEIAPALWKDCAWRIGRADFDDYVQKLPGRLFSPTLRDHIARGIRGIQEKFAENERILGGLNLLLKNDVKPNRYYDLIAAGLEVAKRDVSESVSESLCNKLPSEEIRREVRSRALLLARSVWHSRLRL